MKLITHGVDSSDAHWVELRGFASVDTVRIFIQITLNGMIPAIEVLLL